VFHFRGRSTLEVSQPLLAPAPQVGLLLATLRVVEEDAGGRLVLRAENHIYAADGETPARLSSPLERRTQLVAVERPAFEISGEKRTIAHHLAGGGYDRELQTPFTSDGFGLNAGARREVYLFSLALPSSVFAQLAAGQVVTHEFDFFLVRDDPLADRVVQPVSGSGAERPVAAEARIRGRTVARPSGREPYPVDWRFPAPLAAADSPRPPETARPDRRLELPALRIEVEAEMEIERFERTGAVRSATQRRDRLTWTVHDDRAEPWILAWEGTVADESGTVEDAVRREAYLSRALYRIEEAVLDPSSTPP
jgi:hypothetical protein